MAAVELELPTARWALPLLEPARYKGASGGRASGKSHFFAELAVEHMLCDPSLRFVCIREVQRSLKFSAKSLVEAKIRDMGVSDYFEVLSTEIRRRSGTGVMIFEGMQDHTADSLKSLEGFGRAWVEEAQSVSKRSLDLLLPTIRADDSEIWFSWNPDQPEDPVDSFFAGGAGVHVHSTYLDNRFCPEAMHNEAKRMAAVDPDAYAHIWLGKYNVKSEARVLAGKYRIDEFEPGEYWDGPYHGSDHGFAQDPRTLVRCWVHDRRLYVEYESYHTGLSIDRAAMQWETDVPGFSDYVVRADSAEPGTNDYLKRHGVPKIEGVKKWAGSVADGIAHLRQYDEIVIHPRCVRTIEEHRLYSYRVDKRTGDIMPQVEDRNNHMIDAIRYALVPLMRHSPAPRVRTL